MNTTHAKTTPHPPPNPSLLAMVSHLCGIIGMVLFFVPFVFTIPAIACGCIAARQTRWPDTRFECHRKALGGVAWGWLGLAINFIICFLAVVPVSRGIAELAEKNHPSEILFATQGERFAVRGADGAWRTLFLKGVNFGSGIPGSGPNSRSVTDESCKRWFRQMTELGINCIRIYNFQPAVFYHALAAHNLAHPQTPLYLIQGVWLDDADITHAVTRQTAGFDQAITTAIRRIHGKGTPLTPDVSAWTCALLIGREVMPEEIRATDDEARENADLSSPRTPGFAFGGRHFRLKTGTPTECWIAERLEKAVAFERAEFGTERPVGFSSWPPLDPLTHPTESRDSGEDLVSVDLANLEAVDAPAGFFISYHAYPYNPDFMNEDPGYQKVRDAEGPNPYLGYISELKKHYRGHPLLIAEFGIPSSWACARFNPVGMGHGGHDEAEQGRINVRLLRNIHDSGCAGAVYFSWIDEWWKGNWITRRLNFPQEQRRLWYNVCDPEANYGLIAFDPIPTEARSLWSAEEKKPKTATASTPGLVREVRAAADAAFFHLGLTLARPPKPGERIVVGLDTYADDRGENILPNGMQTKLRCEFALILAAPGNRGDDGLSSPRTPLESGTATGSFSNSKVAESAGAERVAAISTPHPPANSVTLGVKSQPCLRHLPGVSGGAKPAPPDGSAQLYVTPAYDLFGIFHSVAGPEQQFHSVPSSGAGWRPVRWRNAAAHASADGRYQFPARELDIGRLQVASIAPKSEIGNRKSGIPKVSSHTAVVISGNTVEIRLPYTLLQFTDPSMCQVMDDNRETPEQETAVSEGIAVAVSVAGELVETKRFHWKAWNTPPPVIERKKASYFIFQNALKNL